MSPNEKKRYIYQVRKEVNKLAPRNKGGPDTNSRFASYKRPAYRTLIGGEPAISRRGRGTCGPPPAHHVNAKTLRIFSH